MNQDQNLAVYIVSLHYTCKEFTIFLQRHMMMRKRRRRTTMIQACMRTHCQLMLSWIRGIGYEEQLHGIGNHS